MTVDEIRARMTDLGLTVRTLAQRARMDENHLSKSLGKARRQFSVHEMDAIRAALKDADTEASAAPIRTIPHLGKVPAGRFRPEQQQGGKRHVVSDPETPPNAYALTVDGDSMDLIVPDGTTLVVDPDDTALWPGRRYIVMTLDGETTFKEFAADPARLVPCSSNDQHSDIPLGGEPIKILGRVFSYSLRDIPRRAS